MKKDILHLVFIIGAFLSLEACGTEGVKLEPADRAMIDTLVKRDLAVMAREMDKWCVDSTPAIRQRMIDSLVILREQEIRQKLSEAPGNVNYPR